MKTINSIRSIYSVLIWNKVRKKWLRDGRPLPPPHEVKKLLVISNCKKYNINVFVESGTYMGEMVLTTSKFIDQNHTIELSQEIYQKTSARLSHISNIRFHFGDSGKLLYDIIPGINEPICFWLDGHYSAGITAKGDKDTPIIEELAAISQSQLRDKYVILVDDARLFFEDKDSGDYPNIDEFKKYISDCFPNHKSIISDDSICILPKG
jgi:hypothetical protein